MIKRRSKKNHHPRPPVYAKSLYLGWFAVALFYCYQYIFRVAPAVLVTPLRQDFHLTAEDFSTLGSFYLYAYALFQIPLGMLVDRFGVRRVVLSSFATCVVGGVLFAYAPNFPMLQLSRFIIGLGSGSAFMCALKAVMDDLPRGQRGFLMGATLTLGTVGALVAGQPVVSLSQTLGWRSAMLIVSLIGVALWTVAYMVIPRPRKGLIDTHTIEDWQHVRQTLVEIFESRTLVVYAILAVALYTPLSVIADLWGVAFLMQKYQLSRIDASQISMMTYLGLGLGCLVLPVWAEKHQALNRTIRWSAFGLLLAFAGLLYGPMVHPLLLTLLVVLLGFFCGSEMLCFAGAAEYAISHRVGTTLGVVNTLNMLGGGLLQQLIGVILDRLWSGQIDAHGLRVYSVGDYTLALSVLMGVIVLCGLLVFLLPKDLGGKKKSG